MNKSFRSPLYPAIKGEFLVPSYYQDFSCKGADCRNTCCSGWSVKISMKEYFFLHGLQGRKDVRQKLDAALRPLEKRSQEKYAELAFDQFNQCKLLSKEGWCLLHKHYGENVLSSVCRYFPRGPRINYRFEASTSNSCEKTLELLFANDDHLTFASKHLVFYMPIASKSNENDQVLYAPVRDKCIDILQQRNDTLPIRILKIGKLLKGLDDAKPLQEITFEVSEQAQDFASIHKSLLRIGDWFSENTGTFSGYFATIKGLYRDKDAFETYLKHKDCFIRNFPNHEILFEKAIINNIFFKQFPFQDYTKNFYDEFIALAGKYVIMRYLCINLLPEQATTEDLIDLLARMFRVIAHTGFEKNIMILLKNLYLDSIDTLGRLILY